MRGLFVGELSQNEQLIKRMTKKLFRSQKRIDHYSEELRGKSIYGTDELDETASAKDSTSDASSGDNAVTKPEKDSKQDAGASADEKTATQGCRMVTEGSSPAVNTIPSDPDDQRSPWDILMLLLSIYVVVAVVFEILFPLSLRTTQLLWAIDTMICAVFFISFVAQLIRAPR